MTIEHKSYPILGLKADDATGILEAIVSVFNNVDSGKEIVRPGFFSKSIAHKLPKGVWMHDWKQPIAKTLEAKELQPGDPMLPDKLKLLGGTYIKGQFNLETQRGREAYSDIKFGIVDEFSIGYKVLKESTDKETGARELLEGDWKEWSPVLVGMNSETALMSIKSEGGEVEKKDVPVERKGMFEDAIEEREESFYFLTDTLQSALWRCEYLAVNDPNFDQSAALDVILAEFSARIKAKYVDPEEAGEGDELDDMGMMADRSLFSYKGKLRDGLSYAKHAELVLGASEAFAIEAAAVTEMLTELGDRRKQILGRVETKTGATYSGANMAHMQRVHDKIGKVKKDVSTLHADMGALIAKGKPAEKSDEPELDGATLRTQSLKSRTNALLALN